MGGNRQGQPLLPRNSEGIQGARHHRLIDPDSPRSHMEHLKQNGKGGYGYCPDHCVLGSPPCNLRLGIIYLCTF